MPLKTVLEIIQATTAYLAKHGVENARLNSEHLLGHVLGQKRIELYMAADRPVADSELAPLRELVRKRAQREPLQHLLGTVEFYGRSFSVDRRALIPRPETERLVELILKEGAPPGARVLDVGTGSGVIALTLAEECAEAVVTAVDISEEALSLARHNAETLGLAERVTFLNGDLLNGMAGYYDLIVANLPYIPSEVLPTLSPEVRHDPALALDGGIEGLEIILRLLASARQCLEANGLIALEIGDGQSARLLQEMEALGFRDARSEADYHGVQRFLFARLGERN